MSKILIGIPTVHDVASPFFVSMLGMRYDDGNQYSFCVKESSLIYMARSEIALKAIDGGFDYLLFLDSDMVMEPDTVTKLVRDIVETGADVVTGLAFRRCLPTKPVILSKLDYHIDDELGPVDDTEDYLDYPRDRIFEIAGCGMACCIMRSGIIADIATAFRQGPFDPLPKLSEDYAFCWRARQMGKRLLCDSSIKPGHVGTKVFTEDDFLRQIQN